MNNISIPNAVKKYLKIMHYRYYLKCFFGGDLGKYFVVETFTEYKQYNYFYRNRKYFTKA